ncbi:MAG: 30S ribosomal protein S14 [Puniceicoccales bacterium]|jgi:small subunit ribosomal protein S14|nr:30S ribosomal protein S14 [Puniceicoccales bacterium]
MAKKSVIVRNLKREAMVTRYAERRKELKDTLRNPETTDEAFFAARRGLSELPRDASPVRVRHRCAITGRGRAYFGRFGVSRIQLREMVAFGKLPGVIKASW